MSLNKCLEILVRYWPSFLLGIRTTLITAISGTFFGLLIGLLAGKLRNSNSAKRPSHTDV